ncbi:MAG: hypothetical protein M1401_20245 [Chloroflexi bacterium]|nr:hypothetical protein [Chloroflexota bacterium]
MKASIYQQEAEQLAIEEIRKHGGQLEVSLFDSACSVSHRFYELLGQMADAGKIGQRRKDEGLTTVFFLLANK